MIEFAIHLEASDPKRNIFRSYAFTADQDLFGDWVVQINCGRIGSKGCKKSVYVADVAESRHYATNTPINLKPRLLGLV